MNLTSINLVIRPLRLSGMIDVSLKLQHGKSQSTTCDLGLLTQAEAGQLATAFREFADLLSDNGSGDVQREKGFYLEDDKGAWFVDLEKPIEGGGE